MVGKIPAFSGASRNRRAVCIVGAAIWFALAACNSRVSLLDSDGDGVINSLDAFPYDPTEWYDSDGDGIGDNADLDDDNDGVADIFDGPRITPELIDKLRRLDPKRDAYPRFGGNGIPDAEELERRLNDRFAGDNLYLFQFDPTQKGDFFPILATQPVVPALSGQLEIGNLLGDELDLSFQLADTNSNGIPDILDNDIDGDGIPDFQDAFPRDPTEWNDTDGDGVGDNSDCNDDGPGGLAIGLQPCIPDVNAPFGTEPVVLIQFDPPGGPIARCPIDGNVDGIVDDLGVNPTDDPLDPGYVVITTCQDFSTPCLPINTSINPDSGYPFVCHDLLPLGDLDGDGTVNRDDPDIDGDGVLNELDSDFRRDGISDPVDIDRLVPERPDFYCPARLARCDLVPDPVDDDFDNDGCPNIRPPGDPRVIPNCPLTGDRFPNDPLETIDSDNDGVGDNADPCPFDPTNTCGLLGPDADLDGDGTPNNMDLDIDGDGVPNATDRFPYDPFEAFDNDLDGIGDNADQDDDNDGLPDLLEGFPPSVELLLSTGTAMSAERLRCELNCACSSSAPDCQEPAFICQPSPFPVCRLGTSPLFPDSDLDGESDGDEWKRLSQIAGYPVFIKPGNDIPPLTIIDSGKLTYPLLDPDTDGDGILDGSDPSPYGGSTGLPDADGDGLIDAVEQCGGSGQPACLPAQPVPYGTSPGFKDTDGDGLPDPNEVAFDLTGNGLFNDPEDLNTLTYQTVFSFADAAEEICFNSPGNCTATLQACAALLPPVCVAEARAGRQCPAVRLPCHEMVSIGRYDPVNPDAPLPSPPTALNPLLFDTDGDGLSDGEELTGVTVNGITFRTNPLLEDTDGDLWPDDIDNCGTISNLTQADRDFDGIGDACDPAFTLLTLTSADHDSDGLTDNEEIQPRPRDPARLSRPHPSSPALSDTDNDGVPDFYDICPLYAAANPDYADPDLSDSDADGIPDATDGCKCEPGPGPCTQPVIDPADSDGDGMPDIIEFFGLRPGGFRSDPNVPDSDCDEINDSVDNCVCTPNPDQIDSNSNGIGSACESRFGETCMVSTCTP